MCWCTPNSRRALCGKPECTPPLPAHIPMAQKQQQAVLTALPCGGFTISTTKTRCDYGREDAFATVGGAAAAFTDLDAALGWLRTNVGRPAADQAKG